MASKSPDSLPIEEAGYRAVLNTFFACMRSLDEEGVMDLEVEKTSYSTRPGAIVQHQYLVMPQGRLRFFVSNQVEAELTTPEGETILVTLPPRALFQPSEGFNHSAALLRQMQSKDIKRIAAAWTTALDRHLDHDILSIEGNRAVIGLPDQDPVSLQTIANMLHILVRTSGLSGRLRGETADPSVSSENAYSKVSAPFLVRPIEHDTQTFRNHQLFTDANVILGEKYAQSIKPRLAVTASRPRWRGTKDPLYFWKLDFQADAARAGDRLRFQPVEFTEQEQADALALARELGMVIPPKTLAA